MTPPPLKIAVVGLGIMGMRHARCVAAHPDATLAALVDVDPARRDAAARELGGVSVATVTKLKGQVDAAIVAVPTAAHASIAISLLAAGIPCLVEKPFVASRAEGASVAAAAKANGVALQIGHIERFNPAIAALLDRIDDPSSVRDIIARRISGASARVTDIDVVMDLMVHDIDVVLALKRQPVVHVTATGDANHAHASITFADAGVADLTASRIHPVRVRDLRVFIGDGTLEVDYVARSLMETRTGSDESAVSTSQPVHAGDALVSQLDAFIAAVRGAKVVVPVTEALAVMDVAWRVQAALGLTTMPT